MDETIIKSIEACNVLASSTANLETDSVQCRYIPLINLENEKHKGKDYVPEIIDSVKNLDFSFDWDKHIESKTCSMLQKSISVNSSGKKHSQNDSEKSESLRGFQAINGFLPPFRYRDNRKVIIKQWSNDDYERTEKEICVSIKYPYKRFLIVWCLTTEVESELVHSWLKKNTVFIYDRWLFKDNPYSKNVWGGVIAVYSDSITAQKAAEEISQQHESLNAIGLLKVIQYFVKSELKYFSDEYTQISVHAKVSGRENIQKIEAVLYKFGKVEFCSYDYIIRNAAVDFEVAYAFATHAFLAKIVLDNLPFGSCLLDVEVKMTPKTKAIFDDFHSQMKKSMGKLCVPF